MTSRHLSFCVCLAATILSAYGIGPKAGAQTNAAGSVQTDREAGGDAPADPGPLATGLNPRLHRKDIDRAMRMVADWQISAAEQNFNQQWTYAALYDGLIAASRATGDPKYEGAVEHAAAERFHWLLLDERFPHADDEALGQAFLDLYQAQPDPVRIYAITGDRKYLDYMDHEWWITSSLLYDEKEHLFFRDARYLTQKEKNGEPLFWARGNGWVLAGLANVLQFMPEDYPARPRYVAQFQAMAARIASLQQPDGLWKTGLLDPGAYMSSEVSGSAFFTYGIAWGINHRLLDPRVYRPVVEHAWAGMLTHIYASGRLGAIQPVGAAPGSFTPSSSYVYGVGGFLLAGSELDRMAAGQRNAKER